MAGLHRTNPGPSLLGPGGGFRFVLPIVVYNGDRRWNAAMDIRHLFPPAPERLVGYVPRHRYLLIELPIGKQEEQAEMTLIERVRTWREEDRRQWLKEGVERGRIEGERELVYRLVARRFGSGALDRLVPVLDPLSDPERIAAVADAVIECETVDELIARAREVAGAA